MLPSDRSSDNVYVRKRVLLQVLQGTADANIRFEDLRSLLGGLGFLERIRGDHHIFSKPGVFEFLNLQAAWFSGEALPGQAGSCGDHPI